MEAWEKRLGLLSETLDEWVAVQRNWMYLETIFCAEDIQKQLPDEAAKFQASRATRAAHCCSITSTSGIAQTRTYAHGGVLLLGTRFFQFAWEGSAYSGSTQANQHEG